MKLKKCNAVLSLLTFVAMLVHMGYSAFAYLTFYYNPFLKQLTAYPFMVLVCLHAVLGMCSVFFLSDGTRANVYPKKNMRTVVQRVTAALIFPMLILHINTFALLRETASAGQHLFFWLLIASQILFYCVIVAHAAVSFGRALITLGLIASEKALRITDTVIYTLCTLFTIFVAFAVIKGQVAMFLR